MRSTNIIARSPVCKTSGKYCENCDRVISEIGNTLFDSIGPAL